jgi:hypothetical protein
MNWKGTDLSLISGSTIPGLASGELRKATKHLSKDSQPLSRDLNLALPEYKADVLTARLWHKVVLSGKSVIKDHDVKMSGGVGVWLHIFLISALGGGYFVP